MLWVCLAHTHTPDDGLPAVGYEAATMRAGDRLQVSWRVCRHGCASADPVMVWSGTPGHTSAPSLCGSSKTARARHARTCRAGSSGSTYFHRCGCGHLPVCRCWCWVAGAFQGWLMLCSCLRLVTPTVIHPGLEQQCNCGVECVYALAPRNVSADALSAVRHEVGSLSVHRPLYASI